MIQEKKYQIEAVEALVKKTINLLEAQGDRKKLVFKAPTGSGKTVMSSKMLDDLTSQLAEDGKAYHLDCAKQTPSAKLYEHEELFLRDTCTYTSHV